MTPEQSALARRRLWLGITNVGFWVLTAVAGLGWLMANRGGESAIHPLGIVLGLAVIQVVFDGIGGGLLVPMPHRKPMEFLTAWVRGWIVHSLVLAGVGGLGALSLRWTGGFGAGLTVSMVTLALGRRFIHRQSSGAPRRQVVREGEETILVNAVDDPAFTGGIVGFGRRAQILLPQSWWERLPRPELGVELFRRRWQIDQGLPARAFVLLLLWNLLGSFVGTVALNLGALPTALALIGHACWMTLWTFLSLLVLPTVGRATVFAADEAAARAGLDPRGWIRLFPGITGEDGSTRAAIQNIFYPIPSAGSRLQALRHPHHGVVTGNLARANLYYSWAALTPLGRAVHCNVGRPALWVFPPSA